MDSNEGSQATPDTQLWIYVAIGVILIALVAGAFFLFGGEESSKGRDRRSRGFGIKQASWDIRVRAVEGPALPDRKRVVSKKDEERLQRLIKSVYYAAYLRPDLMKKVARRYVAPRAAGAISRWGPQIPAQARRIKTHKRAAIVGVDPRGASRAVARVRVVASGINSGKEFKTTSNDRLWLDRSDGRWQVMAYDVARKPLPTKPSGKDKKEGKGGPGDEKNGDEKKDDKKQERKGSKP